MCSRAFARKSIAMAPPTPSTDYASIQENEIQVLQSIFVDEFSEEETKAAAWNVGASLSKDPI